MADPNSAKNTEPILQFSEARGNTVILHKYFLGVRRAIKRLLARTGHFLSSAVRSNSKIAPWKSYLSLDRSNASRESRYATLQPSGQRHFENEYPLYSAVARPFAMAMD